MTLCMMCSYSDFASGRIYKYCKECFKNRYSGKVAVTLDKCEWAQIQSLLNRVVTHGFKGEKQAAHEVVADQAATLHAQIEEALNNGA